MQKLIELKRSYKPRKKFPEIIRDNPAYERIGHFGDIQSSIESQKKDFRLALQYAEENILKLPLANWTASLFQQWIIQLHKISGKTLVQYSEGEATQEGYRLDLAASMKESPFPDRPFLNKKPFVIFCILVDFDKNLEAGTHFLKWFLKTEYVKDQFIDSSLTQWDQFYSKHLQKEGYNVAEWKSKFFGGKTILEWYRGFFANEGKRFKFPEEDPALLLKAKMHRHLQIDLYTNEEMTAANRVQKIFCPPDEIAIRLEKMAVHIIEMIRKKCAPLSIYTYFHIEFINIHPFENGNGRLARIMGNAILLGHGYPALQLEGEGPAKKAYYLAVEASDRDARHLEDFLREKVIELFIKEVVNNRCEAAKSGNIIKLQQLLKINVDVNHALAGGWTPLHFACAAEQWEAAKCLIKVGANATLKAGINQSTALDLAKRKSEEKARFLFNLSVQVEAERRASQKLAESLAQVVSAPADLSQPNLMPLILIFTVFTKEDTSIRSIIADYAVELPLATPAP